MSVIVRVTVIGLATHVAGGDAQWPLALLLPSTSDMHDGGHVHAMEAHTARLFWMPANDPDPRGKHWATFNRCSLDITDRSGAPRAPVPDPRLLDVTRYSGAKVKSGAVGGGEPDAILSRVRVAAPRVEPYPGSTGYFEIRDDTNDELLDPRTEVMTWLAWMVRADTYADLRISLVGLGGHGAPPLPAFTPVSIGSDELVDLMVFHLPPRYMPPGGEPSPPAKPHTKTDHWQAYYPLFGNPAVKPMPWFLEKGTYVPLPEWWPHELVETNTCMNNRGGG